MGLNLLIDEWDARLGEVAALWGADDGAVVTRHAALWTAPLSGVGVRVRLRIPDDGARGYMTPEIVVTRTGVPVGDPLRVLAVLDDAAATIYRAAGAFHVLADCLIWTTRAPCDQCSARGTTDGSRCDRCHGTGYRHE